MSGYLVAASTGGLGLAVATVLARQGHAVSICGRDEDRLAAALDGLAGLPGRAVGRPFDLAEPEAPAAWAEWSSAELGGPLDGVFVNTGGPPPAPFAATTDASWIQGFESVVLPAVRLARAAYPLLADGGSVVFLTSSVVLEPALTPDLVVSASLRSAVATLAKSLAGEWAPRVRVNHVVPGRIATDRVRSLDARRAAAAGTDVSAVEAASHARIPMGRYGDPAEFGELAAWLLSPAASYVTGSTFRADGGLVSAP